ncbi:MAG: hypothetical protein CFE26_12010 [Verrucomicrobiales bacterium VVV1]|nr:MAG: hypothetical protein CFE26_12010 [Verrucomicrobiales bacterium VVV1]
MTIDPAAWMILAVLVALPLGMSVIRLLARRFSWSAEITRKAVHISMGLVCAAFPWCFDNPRPVWWLALLITVPLALIRWNPLLRQGLGSVLHGVARPSYGEILFAPAVATVFHLSHGDPWLHAIPIAILAIADAAGALAGTGYGKRRYICGEGLKSVEGSTAFLIASFLCAALPLAMSGRTDWPHAFWIGLTLAILTMMAEGVSDRGFDNLVIPVGACLVLTRLLPLEIASLVTRSLVASSLLAFVLTASRWSTLNGGALLGYGCAILADARFILPLLGLFACHLGTTHRHQLKDHLGHRLDAVLSPAIAILPWVLAVQLKWLDSNRGLAGACFAIAAQISILDVSTRWWLGGKGFNPLKSLTKGWLAGAFPGLALCLASLGDLPAGLAAGVLASVVVTLIFQRIRPLFLRDCPELWITKGLFALSSSLAALLLTAR